ncbi:hypothetical protein ACVDG8_011940 [Mesorhizobium sp. ORM8.1]
MAPLSHAGADKPRKTAWPIVLIDRIVCNFDHSGLTTPAPMKLAGDHFFVRPFVRVIGDGSCA